MTGRKARVEPWQVFQVIVKDLDDEAMLVRSLLLWQGLPVHMSQDWSDCLKRSRGKGTVVVVRGVDTIAVGFFELVTWLTEHGMTRC